MEDLLQIWLGLERFLNVERICVLNGMIRIFELSPDLSFEFFLSRQLSLILSGYGMRYPYMAMSVKSPKLTNNLSYCLAQKSILRRAD